MSWSHGMNVTDSAILMYEAGHGITANCTYRNLYFETNWQMHPEMHEQYDHDLYSPFRHGQIAKPNLLLDALAQVSAMRKKRFRERFRGRSLVLTLPEVCEDRDGEIYAGIKKRLRLKKLGLVDRALAIAEACQFVSNERCVVVHHDDDHLMIASLQDGKILERLVIGGGVKGLCRRVQDWYEREKSILLGPGTVRWLLTLAFPDGKVDERGSEIKVTGKSTKTGLPVELLSDAGFVRQVMTDAAQPDRAKLSEFFNRQNAESQYLAASVGGNQAEAFAQALDFNYKKMGIEKWTGFETPLSVLGTARIMEDSPDYVQIVD